MALVTWTNVELILCQYHLAPHSGRTHTETERARACARERDSDKQNTQIHGSREAQHLNRSTHAREYQYSYYRPSDFKTKSFTVLHQVSWAPMYRCSTVMWHSIQCFVASPLRPVHLCRYEDYLCKRSEIAGEKEAD